MDDLKVEIISQLLQCLVFVDAVQGMVSYHLDAPVLTMAWTSSPDIKSFHHLTALYTILIYFAVWSSFCCI